MRRLLLVLTTMGLVSGAFAANEPDIDAAPVLTPALVSEQQALQAALDQLSRHDVKGADAALQSVIAAPAFADLNSEEQHRALVAAGAVAVELRDLKRGHELLQRSSEMAEATGFDWVYRYVSAGWLQDDSDALLSLLRLEQQWPDMLSQIPHNDEEVFKLVAETKKMTANTQYQLLDALYVAQWKPENGQEPSDLWRDLALLLLDRSQTDRAEEVASRVTAPYTLISMRADKRFAPLLQHDPAHYDVDKAAAHELEQLRAATAAAPTALETLTAFYVSLLDLRRYDEALTLTDAAAKQKDADQAGDDDAKTRLALILGVRSAALQGLNRWDEAIAVEIRASQLPEYGSANVNEAIDLGEMYCEVNRPKDALKAIATVGNTSPYGTMQLDAVRYAAQLEMNDQAAADATLAYMRQHQTDALETFQEELVRGRHLDEAATLLISRLGSPVQRSSALLAMQQYTEPPVTAHTLEWRAQWTALLNRPDVQAALSSVGDIEHYNLDRVPPTD